MPCLAELALCKAVHRIPLYSFAIYVYIIIHDLCSQPKFIIRRFKPCALVYIIYFSLIFQALQISIFLCYDTGSFVYRIFCFIYPAFLPSSRSCSVACSFIAALLLSKDSCTGSNRAELIFVMLSIFLITVSISSKVNPRLSNRFTYFEESFILTSASFCASASDTRSLISRCSSFL